MKIPDLTRGERLVLARRRAQKTQIEAARMHGVSIYQYGRWERGEDVDTVPGCNLGRLRDYEICYVLRMRRGIPVGTLARRIGVSRWWLTQIEYGRAPAEVAVAHWREKARKAS